MVLRMEGTLGATGPLLSTWMKKQRHRNKVTQDTLVIGLGLSQPPPHPGRTSFPVFQPLAYLSWQDLLWPRVHVSQYSRESLLS